MTEACEGRHWADDLNVLVRRFSLILVSFAYSFEPYRADIGLLGDVQLSVEVYLNASEDPFTGTVTITDLEYCCHSAGQNLLGPLRERIMGVDSGVRFILLSRYPRSRFPGTTGSSLLDDAKFFIPPLLPSTDGSPLEILPITLDVMGSITETELFERILAELGTDVIASLDQTMHCSRCHTATRMTHCHSFHLEM